MTLSIQPFNSGDNREAVAFLLILIPQYPPRAFHTSCRWVASLPCADATTHPDNCHTSPAVERPTDGADWWNAPASPSFCHLHKLNAVKLAVVVILSPLSQEA